MVTVIDITFVIMVVGSLVGFYDISTYVHQLMQNLFSYE